jgi:hypothetical protein
MGEKKEGVKKELTYDELKNVAGQLQQQNKFLIEQLQKNEYADLHKRIEYLFKVLEHKNTFANTDSGFVDEVISELISILKIEKQPEVEEVK